MDSRAGVTTEYGRREKILSTTNNDVSDVDTSIGISASDTYVYNDIIDTTFSDSVTRILKFLESPSDVIWSIVAP